MAIGPTDERRHDADLAVDNDTGAGGWNEVWDLDFVTTDGALAATFSMLLNATTGRAGYALSLVGPTQDLVTLADFDMAGPKPPGLEVRAPGLWSEFICQVPFDHFTVDVEAFAVQLDDPEAVFEGAYGVRVAVGCELEWETDGPVVPMFGSPGWEGYAVPCRVTGEWLLDDAVIEIEGWGWRRHRWGQIDTLSAAVTPGAATTTWWRGRTTAGEWVQGGVSAELRAGTIIATAPRPDGVRHNLMQMPSGLLWVDVG